MGVEDVLTAFTAVNKDCAVGAKLIEDTKNSFFVVEVSGVSSFRVPVGFRVFRGEIFHRKVVLLVRVLDN